MAGRTISEKILSAKSGHDARAGDVVICRVDYAMGTDGSVPMALDYFAAMGGGRVFAPERIVFALGSLCAARRARTPWSFTRASASSRRSRASVCGRWAKASGTSS